MPISLQQFSLKKRGLGVKGQWLKIATGIHLKGVCANLKASALFKVCCVRCL
jgi:hypothetical protein